MKDLFVHIMKDTTKDVVLSMLRKPASATGDLACNL